MEGQWIGSLEGEVLFWGWDWILGLSQSLTFRRLRYTVSDSVLFWTRCSTLSTFERGTSCFGACETGKTQQGGQGWLVFCVRALSSVVGLVLVGLLFGRGGGRNWFFATNHTDAHGCARIKTNEFV